MRRSAISMTKMKWISLWRKSSFWEAKGLLSRWEWRIKWISSKLKAWYAIKMKSSIRFEISFAVNSKEKIFRFWRVSTQSCSLRYNNMDIQMKIKVLWTTHNLNLNVYSLNCWKSSLKFQKNFYDDLRNNKHFYMQNIFYIQILNQYILFQT